MGIFVQQQDSSTLCVCVCVCRIGFLQLMAGTRDTRAALSSFLSHSQGRQIGKDAINVVIVAAPKVAVVTLHVGVIIDVLLWLAALLLLLLLFELLHQRFDVRHAIAVIIAWMRWIQPKRAGRGNVVQIKVNTRIIHDGIGQGIVVKEANDAHSTISRGARFVQRGTQHDGPCGQRTTLWIG